MSSSKLDKDLLVSLLAKYKEEYSQYPKSGRHLYNFAKETDGGKSYRYSEVCSMFKEWKNDNVDCKDEEAETSKKQKDGAGDADDDEDEQEIDWDEIWQNYVETYKCPPKQPVHLWNHARESCVVKYKEARDNYKRLSERYNVQKKKGEKDHIAPPAPKKKQITRDEFETLLSHYRTKYEGDPKDAKMLYTFAVESEHTSYRYGAISRGFSQWFIPLRTRKRSRSRSSLGKSVSLSPQSKTSLLTVNTNINVEGEGEKETETEKDKDIKPLNETESILSDDTLSSAATASATTVDECIVGTPRDKEKDITKEIFLEIYTKYKDEHNATPKSCHQLTSFAVDKGYHVRYGAITRAFSQWETETQT